MLKCSMLFWSACGSIEMMSECVEVLGVVWRSEIEVRGWRGLYSFHPVPLPSFVQARVSRILYVRADRDSNKSTVHTKAFVA
jgi:hypothetical protein